MSRRALQSDLARDQVPARLPVFVLHCLELLLFLHRHRVLGAFTPFTRSSRFLDRGIIANFVNEVVGTIFGIGPPGSYVKETN